MGLCNEWMQALGQFMDARLKGPGDACAHLDKAFELDGLAMAIGDHPELWQESLVALTTHLRACRAPHDRYTAWCAIDATLKCPETPAPLRAELLHSLPDLISSHLPLSGSRPGGDGGGGESDDAQRELQPLYLALLRSWTALPGLPLGVLQRCELQLRALLRVQRGGSAASVVTPAGAASSAGAATRAAGIVKKLRDLAEAQSRQKAVTGTGSRGTAAGGGGLQSVAAFVGALYDTRRTASCCTRCGAYFSTPEAKVRHLQLHNVVSTQEKASMVRRRGLSAADFAAYNIDHSSGAFASIFIPLRDVDVAGAVLPPSHVGSVHEDLAAKRKRGESFVVVPDPEQEFFCHACRQPLRPQLVRSEWVLHDVHSTTLVVDGAERGVFFHTGCWQ